MACLFVQLSIIIRSLNKATNTQLFCKQAADYFSPAIHSHFDLSRPKESIHLSLYSAHKIINFKQNQSFQDVSAILIGQARYGRQTDRQTVSSLSYANTFLLVQLPYISAWAYLVRTSSYCFSNWLTQVEKLEQGLCLCVRGSSS